MAKSHLEISIKNKSLEDVRYFIENGADLEKMLHRNDRMTPLHFAIYTGIECLPIIQYLVQCGANIEARSDNGWTPLHRAVRNGLVEIVTYLLDNGANVNSVTSYYRNTSLHLATIHEHLSAVKALLEAGIDYTLSDGRKRTAKDIAQEEGYTEIYNLLQAYEDSPDIKEPE